MPKLVFLGTSNAIPDADHDSTHMVLAGAERTVLIDCVNSPILRLQQAGIDPGRLTDVILTHFHPDHVSGIPQLLMNMWLMGRRSPLDIYGLHHTLDRVEDMMGLFGWAEWPNFFSVAFHRLPLEELTPVLTCTDFMIMASPVQHFIPCIGLRVEIQASGRTMAYSCDTEPCPQVLRLAAGVDVLVHEAAGEILGHSSAAQAGEAAAKAEVGALYLIHYPTGQLASGDPVAEAGERFQGPVRLAEDFMVIDLG
jgi:ribonuclease Z